MYVPYRRGSDVKKLRKLALDILGPSVSDDDLNAILPAKADVQMVKMSNKALVFTVKDQPLFFDPNGRGRVFPTVYTMWAFPDAMKSLLTFSEVSPKVLGGADLMLPGVIVPPEGIPDFDADETMALRIPENPYPFAIGEIQVSSTEAKEGGMKGRGLKVLHHFPDPIWAMEIRACHATRSGPRVPLARTCRRRRRLWRRRRDGWSAPCRRVAAMSISDGDGGGRRWRWRRWRVASHRRLHACRAMLHGCLRDKLKDADLPMRCELFYANCLLPSRPGTSPST